MKTLRFQWRQVAAILACLILVGLISSTASAQDVVAIYPDEVGTIVRLRVSDGVEVSRIRVVYRVGTTVCRPTHIAMDANGYYVVFQNRYLARVRPSDGAILWVVDAGVTIPSAPATIWNVADVAAAGNSVFIVNYDPGRRIAKYRAADGVVLGTRQLGIQVGLVKQLPFRLAATGDNSLYSLVGYYFLNRMRQSDIGDVWVKNVAITAGPLTWAFGDLTAGGGFEYVSYVDTQATLRKFNDGGTLVWEQTRLARGLLGAYQITRMAASGSDSVLVLFGDRTLARMRAVDGVILWSKNVSLPGPGYVPFVPADIAAVGAP